MACAWDDLPAVPPPTKLMDELQERRHPTQQSANSSGDMDGIIDEIRRRLDKCSADICALQSKQDDMFSQQQISFKKRQDELDVKHRNQIDCISDRIFDAEKQLSEAQKRQDEALRAANAAFENERENLMSVIGQVNRNFDHLTSELANNSSEVKGMELKMDMLERTLEAQTQDLQVLQSQESDMGIVNASVQRLEQLLQSQQAHSSRLESGLHDQKLILERVAPECSDCATRLRALSGQVTELEATVTGTESSLSMVLQKLVEQERTWSSDTSRRAGANASESRANVVQSPPAPPFAPFGTDGRLHDEIGFDNTRQGPNSVDAVNFAWAASQQGKMTIPRRANSEQPMSDLHSRAPRQSAAWDEIDMQPRQQQDMWGSLPGLSVEPLGQLGGHLMGPDASALPNFGLRL
mmetsp:Transcript_37121/g.57577  ORF Transcript_37121/g.57577 Transcript_37121/m.57577 type:complete len:410 (-) Transcript_37121:86-1315(-)